jgi:hypothetical protein
MVTLFVSGNFAINETTFDLMMAQTFDEAYKITDYLDGGKECMLDVSACAKLGI